MPYNNYEGPTYSVLNGKPMTYCCNIGCPHVLTSQCDGNYSYATYESCIAANSGDAC
jgi:hypothetical protein